MQIADPLSGLLQPARHAGLEPVAPPAPHRQTPAAPAAEPQQAPARRRDTSPPGARRDTPAPRAAHGPARLDETMHASDTSDRSASQLLLITPTPRHSGRSAAKPR